MKSLKNLIIIATITFLSIGTLFGCVKDKNPSNTTTSNESLKSANYDKVLLNKNNASTYLALEYDVTQYPYQTYFISRNYRVKSYSLNKNYIYENVEISICLDRYDKRVLAISKADTNGVASFFFEEKPLFETTQIFKPIIVEITGSVLIPKSS